MKILVAEHHPITYKGIKDTLKSINSTFEIFPPVISGENLYNSVKKHTPDVLILELDLPNTNGIQSIKDIKTDFKGIKIFVYSHQPGEIYALTTIKAGASAYLCKTATIDTLRFALDRVFRGGIYLDEKLNKQLNERGHRSAQHNTFKKLSSREVEVLNLLSNGSRNKDIANKLEINEKTVSTYKTRLLKKLKVNNIADLINQSRILHLTD